VETAINVGKQTGVTVLPGIELPAIFAGKEHHLLGLGIDYESPLLCRFLRKWEQTKKDQTQAILFKINELGFRVDMRDVRGQVCGSWNRIHIAYAVLENQQNAGLLEKHKIKSSGEFFHKFLKDSLPYFVERELPSVSEVIELIKNIDGVAIWAHPLWKGDSYPVIEKKIKRFRSWGLDGLETVYCSDLQTPNQTKALHEIAQQHFIFETVGSDFHSPGMQMLNKVGNFDDLDLKLNFPFKIN
jgi:hypothetical protein